MDLFIYILSGIGVIALTVVLYFVLKKPAIKEKKYDVTVIKQLLEKSNISSIKYIRNKIVIEFKDVSSFDTEKLLENGALGINIVGDKVKFYLDGGNEKNVQVFNELKRYIEG